jgi:hypothetical protein
MIATERWGKSQQTLKNNNFQHSNQQLSTKAPIKIHAKTASNDLSLVLVQIFLDHLLSD